MTPLSRDVPIAGVQDGNEFLRPGSWTKLCWWDLMGSDGIARTSLGSWISEAKVSLGAPYSMDCLYCLSDNASDRAGKSAFPVPSFLLETESRKEMESWPKKRGCLRVPVPSTVPSPGQQLLLCNEHPASNHHDLWVPWDQLLSIPFNYVYLCLCSYASYCLNCPVAWREIDVMTLCVCCTESVGFQWFPPVHMIPTGGFWVR